MKTSQVALSGTLLQSEVDDRVPVSFRVWDVHLLAFEYVSSCQCKLILKACCMDQAKLHLKCVTRYACCKIEVTCKHSLVTGIHAGGSMWEAV